MRTKFAIEQIGRKMSARITFCGGFALALDLSTPAGLHAYERLTTGDLSEFGGDAPVDNPPLLRILDIGFFNPGSAFDLAFFEEVAHSGFWVGASWNFGSVDSMHFELAEGRNSLHMPGKPT